MVEEFQVSFAVLLDNYQYLLVKFYRIDYLNSFFNCNLYNKDIDESYNIKDYNSYRKNYG